MPGKREQTKERVRMSFALLRSFVRSSLLLFSLGGFYIKLWIWSGDGADGDTLQDSGTTRGIMRVRRISSIPALCPIRAHSIPFRSVSLRFSCHFPFFYFFSPLIPFNYGIPLRVCCDRPPPSRHREWIIQTVKMNHKFVLNSHALLIIFIK